MAKTHDDEGYPIERGIPHPVDYAKLAAYQQSAQPRGAEAEAVCAAREALCDRGDGRAAYEALRAVYADAACCENCARLEDALRSGEASDGYHTHRELYAYRMLYNAHAARGWMASGIPVVKSRRHSDGEPCFGGGWFIVTAQLPTGQVSNHYREEHWDLFDVPAVEIPPEYDGHTPAEAAARLEDALR